jgi:hypothetical protein
MNCARHQKERQVLVLGTFVNATAAKLGGAAQAAVRARSVIDILRADFTTLLDINNPCHNRALSFFATSSIEAKAIIHLPSQQTSFPEYPTRTANGSKGDAACFGHHPGPLAKTATIWQRHLVGHARASHSMSRFRSTSIGTMRAKGLEEQSLIGLDFLESWSLRPRSLAMGHIAYLIFAAARCPW